MVITVLEIIVGRLVARDCTQRCCHRDQVSPGLVPSNVLVHTIKSGSMRSIAMENKVCGELQYMNRYSDVDATNANITRAVVASCSCGVGILYVLRCIHVTACL